MTNACIRCSFNLALRTVIIALSDYAASRKIAKMSPNDEARNLSIVFLFQKATRDLARGEGVVVPWCNRPFSYSTKESGSSDIFIHFYTQSSIEWR